MSTRRSPPKWRGSSRRMLKPRALRPGDRIGIVAPASPFARESFDAGVAELRRLGYEPVYDDSVFARPRYTAADAASRARALPPALHHPATGAPTPLRGRGQRSAPTR